jgi:hypothetical protein
MQDSIDVFENPVDSVRVAVQDITSQQVTNKLDLWESLVAFWNLVHPEYLAFVCLAYYIFVTRVQFIKTNTKGRRNLLMLVLTSLVGFVQFYWREASPLSLFVTAGFVNAAREYIFKWIFMGLEKIGWTPLPEWYVEDIREEKMKDIARAEQVKKQ